MFHVGDLIIYSSHGICHIDEICEKTLFGVTRTYYIIHPLENQDLTISAPVDQETIFGIVGRLEAAEILQSFQSPGIPWIEKINERTRMYSDIIKTGDRKKISSIVNTLMRKKMEIEHEGKKFAEADRKLLQAVQRTLFCELAISLNKSFDTIHEEATQLIKLNDLSTDVVSQ